MCAVLFYPHGFFLYNMFKIQIFISHENEDKATFFIGNNHEIQSFKILKSFKVWSFKVLKLKVYNTIFFKLWTLKIKKRFKSVIPLKVQPNPLTDKTVSGFFIFALLVLSVQICSCETTLFELMLQCKLMAKWGREVHFSKQWHAYTQLLI
jgi:hypothetical protein